MTYEEGYRAGYQCARVTMPDVVRCKDCKHHGNDTCSAAAGIAFPPPDDWFCADGERKEGR